MYDSNKHAFCSEFYSVAKSIEVVAKIQDQSRRIRIEALHDERDGKYSTKAYIEVDVQLHPTSQSNGKFVENFSIWAAYDLPWTHTNSVELALGQALGLLRERVPTL